MDDLFGKHNRKAYQSALHGEVSLTRSSWSHITRGHGELVRLNAHLIETALDDPSEVRQSQHPKDCDTYVYYSSPKEIFIKPGVMVPARDLLFAVVIDAALGLVKTAYIARPRIPGKVVHKR